MFCFQTDTEWHIVFYISAGIYLLGCLFYALAASGNRQPWADVKAEDADKTPTVGDVIPLESVAPNLANYGTNS